MKLLRDLLDQAAPHFHRGGILERFYPAYEAADTFLYTPGEVTRSASHVRDSLDLKRMMITVVVSLVPCIFMGDVEDTGYQANLALAEMGLASAGGWRGIVIDVLEIGYDPGNIIANLFHGALYFIPVFLVCNIVGGYLGGAFLHHSPPRDQRGFPGNGDAVSPDPAADDSAVAGGDRHQFRRRHRQGDFRRHRQELPQPGP